MTGFDTVLSMGVLYHCRSPLAPKDPSRTVEGLRAPRQAVVLATG
jgi:hypothetical protein